MYVARPLPSLQSGVRTASVSTEDLRFQEKRRRGFRWLGKKKVNATRSPSRSSFVSRSTQTTRSVVRGAMECGGGGVRGRVQEVWELKRAGAGRNCEHGDVQVEPFGFR